MAEVKIEHVRKAYGQKVVYKDLNLTINDGECFTLLGPSGCGKTVMLRMIAGFESPDAGTIKIGGVMQSSPADKIMVPPDERSLGVVFQDYAVWPHMTVKENVIYPLKMQKVEKGEAERRTREAISNVNLTGLEDRLPSQLSGGQQQRVAIARALALQPDVLCFDEPTSALDPELTGEVLKVIRSLAEEKTTMIIVTHEMAFARDVSDQLIFMDGGVIVEQGDPHQVIDNPQQERTKRFLRNYQS